MYKSKQPNVELCLCRVQEKEIWRGYPAHVVENQTGRAEFQDQRWKRETVATEGQSAFV